MQSKGSLVCVGLGMTLGAHLTPAALSRLQNADVVFIGASSGIVEEWVKSINPNSISLQPLYHQATSRKETYKLMVEAMLEEVRAGKKVCGAFYGHPGVFAQAPHKAILKAQSEGYDAYMEPGISADDCLFADLNLDPGATGCQQFEANQYLYYKRVIDTASLLILWQIGVVGDKDSKNFTTDKTSIQSLVDKLSQTYSLDHQVIIYEAKLLSIDKIRKDKIRLKDLPEQQLTLNSTLVVPPINRLIDISG